MGSSLQFGVSAALFLGALGAGAFGFLIGQKSSGHSAGGGNITFQSAPADPKVEQSYVRSGIGERILTPERRAILGTCYQEFLARITDKKGENVKEEGKVGVVFQIAEDGKMLSYEIIDNQLNEPGLTECVENQMKDLRFLPPPLGINRYIVYDFWFKKEETVLKEMEERRNRPPLELITTTPTPQP